MDNYVGKRLDGRYEIQEIIGVGGMAVVYKAYDNIDDRIVAVKILKEEFLANDEFRRRFKNESKAIAVLSHPNIVKVYDVSYGDKLQYIVMEYIEGITLKEYIEQQGGVSWKEAVHFVMQILRALQHAHDKGIVHRDIKPQNILLLQNGNIKVTDFGIARFSRSETRTMTESAIGSVHYISPEQARGDITDDKADLYSVGVVMYEMLTGQLPFQSESSVSVAIMQLQSEAKRPSEINPDIPPGLEQITMRAMRKKPRDRYQSAAEMLLDLEEFKRNPVIRFEYSYFVDNDPTKYINSGDSIATQEAYAQEDGDLQDEEIEENQRVVPIITGIAVGLVALLAIIMSILYFAGVFHNDDKIEVQKFIGMNYYIDIENNDEYSDYKFIIVEEQSSDKEAGEVIKQNPSKGEIIKVGEDVTLTIAIGNEITRVPEVSGLSLDEAKIKLISAGFTNISGAQYEYSTTVEKDKVIRTDPSSGSEVNVNTQIAIYLATDDNTDSLVKVPKLIGWSLSDAKDMLESANLVLSDNVTRQDSDKPQDEVVGQSINAGDPVPVGTAISVVVSTGIPASSSASIKFKLPNIGAGVDGVLKVYMDNVIVDNVSNVTMLLNGSDYAFTVSGSGKDKILQAFIEGIPVYECTIDFTKSPAKVRNEKFYDYKGVDNGKSVPDVTRQAEEVAKQMLKNTGFKNIVTEKVLTDDVAKIGIVIRQTPVAGETHDLSEAVTIFVGVINGVAVNEEID
ncbi:MAG TPA: Stk1 family PASTA domain-containing Ser/Thr kinase [Clostridia bacterium]|nr:Stk1 family PASTA domain-containing Ser/Thr kinase [Clostridia bacterium]